MMNCSLYSDASLFVYSKQWRLLLLFAKSFAVSGIMIGRSKGLNNRRSPSRRSLLPFLPLRRLPRLLAPFARSLIACCSASLPDMTLDGHFAASNLCNIEIK